MLSYKQKRDRLSSTLLAGPKKGSRISLKKETSNLFRPRAHSSKDIRLDAAQFNRVINVDPVHLAAEVEGMTTYEDLVNETLRHSCLPAVVPELKSITVGGALSGCGIESSSFQYGLVHETIEEFDVLLSDGDVVTCRPDNALRELYYAFPNTFGTLGYALRARVKLIPAKDYVKLTHQRFGEPDTFFAALQSQCEEGRSGNGPDFIEGVIFGPDEMVVTTAKFVEEVPFTSDYTWKKIYFQSLREKEEDYLTTYDYIWRWDTDWFWCSDVFFMQNALLRSLFGKVLLGSKRFTKVMHFFHRHPSFIKALSILSGKQESIIQDVCIPIERAGEFYDYLESEIGIHPVWVCPTKCYRADAHFDFCPVDPKKLYLDFGFWKSIPSDKEEGHYNRLIEKMTVHAGGFKSLYSSSYYTEKEFWNIYDEQLYRQIKEKYDPSNSLRDLYGKCCKTLVEG